jgi:hypothetical protein
VGCARDAAASIVGTWGVEPLPSGNMVRRPHTFRGSNFVSPDLFTRGKSSLFKSPRFRRWSLSPPSSSSLARLSCLQARDFFRDDRFDGSLSYHIARNARPRKKKRPPKIALLAACRIYFGGGENCCTVTTVLFVDRSTAPLRAASTRAFSRVAQFVPLAPAADAASPS